ncbi:MAG: RNA polymerase sigma factor [Aquaticitalea sp.]
MKPIQNSNNVLWQKLKDGDVEALGQLYDFFVDDLFSYGLQFSQEKQEVMDCIHDLFLNLYKYRKKLASTDNVKYYLFRSLKNQILKAPKSKSLSITKSVFPEDGQFANSAPSYEEELIETEFFDERAFQLSHAMSALSKKQKQCIFLRFTEDRQYEEIAEIMNVSVQTSRTIIYRAIKLLRSNLAPIIILYFIFS